MVDDPQLRVRQQRLLWDPLGGAVVRVGEVVGIVDDRSIRSPPPPG